MEFLENQKKYFGFQLTPEQEEVVRKLLEFFDGDGHVFVLRGYAGTGKTSLVKGIIQYLASKSVASVLLASTGRAAKILSDKAKVQVQTVHSRIYTPVVKHLEHLAVPGKNPDIREFRLEFELDENEDPEDTVYFVDESSMISNHKVRSTLLDFGSGRLLSDYFEYLGPRKVVFIGDPAQLPPVNTRFSAALNTEYLTSQFGKKVVDAELTRIMRFPSGAGIAANTERLRRTIQKGKYPYLTISVSEFNDCFRYKNDREFVQAYVHSIRERGVDNNILLVLSNKAAARYNHKVRSGLFGRKALEPLNTGEALMVVRNNYHYGVYNGDLVYFEKANRSIKRAGMEFIDVHIRLNEAGEGARLIRSYAVKDLLLSDERDLTLEQEKNIQMDFFIRMGKVADALVRGKENRITAENVVKLNQHLRSRWGYTVELPEKIMQKSLSKTRLRKELVIANYQTDPFLNAIRLKYGYAVTCHKAQGGEWEDVFILLDPVLFYTDKENQYRWAYTAISRSVKRIHFLDNMCIY
ncbi:MAG TPA: hypothetical protein ENK25_02345 [Bacteroidetes bacterium]|nr:hypothetical protein [Bacteroidota bacterium]